MRISVILSPLACLFVCLFFGSPRVLSRWFCVYRASISSRCRTFWGVEEDVYQRSEFLTDVIGDGGGEGSKQLQAEIEKKKGFKKQTDRRQRGRSRRGTFIFWDTSSSRSGRSSETGRRSQTLKCLRLTCTFMNFCSSKARLYLSPVPLCFVKAAEPKRLTFFQENPRPKDTHPTVDVETCRAAFLPSVLVLERL